ncbi:uncharacterized protein B0J16DRAFT_391050 [Fusarium flagelliforme]|uniref:uncharacterized protein n=1 Tax=Fusarium flagelliforme TaxID=2675880 RepID=UPI001E8D7089|nr:uncharacterized protein B0J16DRAFT_391050 [Fusarium flagelliforme]KAH7197273.1 hypothetical protein B0J16DRAFT_391050 [Fusarium flagelliforme]
MSSNMKQLTPLLTNYFPGNRFSQQVSDVPGEQVSPCGFKIFMPLSNEAGTERRIYRLNIKDLSKWKHELQPKRRANKVNRVSRATGAINDQGPNSAESSPPDSPESVSSCDSPMYTLDEIRLLVPGSEDGDIDSKTIADRWTANMILEACFNVMAVMEEREHGKARRRAAWKSTLQSRLAIDGPKGWEFLHSVICDGQSPELGAQQFPAYHPKQKAYILTRDFKGGKYIVSAVRNLNACSAREVSKLMNRIGERGWQDVIYVAMEDEDIPYCFEGKVEDYEQELLNWGERVEEEMETW